MLANIGQGGAVKIEQGHLEVGGNWMNPQTNKLAGNTVFMLSKNSAPYDGNVFIDWDDDTPNKINNLTSSLQINSNNDIPVVVMNNSFFRPSGIRVFNPFTAVFDLTMGGPLESGAFNANWARLVTKSNSSNHPSNNYPLGLVIGHTNNNAPITFIENNNEMFTIDDYQLKLFNSSGSFTALKTSNTATSTTYTLPSSDGSLGEYLITDGSGNLSWGPAIDNTTQQDDNDWTVSGNDMYSTPTGNVGIGITQPQKKFHLNGDGKITGVLHFGHDLTSGWNSNQTAMFVEDMGTLSFSATTMWGNNFENLKFKGFGGVNYLPTGNSGKLSGGILINTGSNYWAKSTLHIHSNFAQETTPRVIKSLTLSTSGSGDEGDGIGVDFEFPSQSNITNLAASIDVG